MKYMICSIRDLGSHEYKGLTLEPNEYSALRSFESSVITSCNSGQGLLFSHPEDFELHVLGEFDSSAGELKPIKSYRLVDALDVYPDQEFAIDRREKIMEESLDG